MILSNLASIEASRLSMSGADFAFEVDVDLMVPCGKMK